MGAPCINDNGLNHRHNFGAMVADKYHLYKCGACGCLGYWRPGGTNGVKAWTCAGGPGEPCSAPVVEIVVRGGNITPSRRRYCRKHKGRDPWKQHDR